MLDAQLLRLARRVERVGDHDETLRRETLGDRHRAHASTHRTPAPPELLESGSVPTRVGEDGSARPISTAYQVRITLDLPEDSTLILRGTGRARIEAASQSTARRLLRFLRQTFRFRS